jgi:hypothetical protein
VKFTLYVERRVSAVVEVEAPDLATALEMAEMPGETEDVDPAGEWETLYAYDADGNELLLPTEVAGGQKSR